MAETVRDLLGAAKERGFTADQLRSRFREKYNQELDDYEDKLDTPLEQISAIKPKAPAILTEPKTPALGIAPEPKSAFATVREALTKPESIAALAPAAGRAIGGLPGELAGMGLGLLAAGKKPAMPRVRMPAAPVAEAPRPAEPVAEAPKPGFFAQRGLQYKPLPELALEERPMLQAPRAPESMVSKLAQPSELRKYGPMGEETFGYISEPEKAKIPTTLEEEKEAARKSAEAAEEGELKKTARSLIPFKATEETLLGKAAKPYEKERVAAEAEQWQTLKEGGPGKVKWPTPSCLAYRLAEAPKEAARKIFGEGKLSREIEERGALGALRDVLAKGVEPGEEAYRGPAIENIDPFAPRPSDPERATLWDQIQKDPELKKEAERRWRPIRARREAEGVPLGDEGLPEISWEEIKKQQRPAYEQIAKEREELQPRSGWMVPITAPINFMTDLTVSTVGLIDSINKALGPAIPAETPQVQAARARYLEAKRGGDEKEIKDAADELNEAQQRAIGGEVGGGLAQMPGQMAGVAKGLIDPSLKNTALTKPFQALTLLQGGLAARKLLKAQDVGFKVKNRWAVTADAPKEVKVGYNALEKAVVDGGKKIVDMIVPDELIKARAVVSQFVADSLHTGSRVVSQILDDIFTGKKGAVDRLREEMQREVAAGQVELNKLDPDTIQAVDIWMRPEEKAGEIRAATRKAEEARAKAEKFASAKKMTAATAEQLAELNKEQTALQRAAENVEKQIVQAAGSADTIRLQVKLKELQVEQDRLARREETLRKQSVQRGKAKVAAEAAVETAVPFVERMVKEAPGVKREGRKVSREFMSQMAEMERRESLADEALRRGLTSDEVKRQREDAIIDRLGERAYEKAGQAAVAGIDLAERARAMQPVATALQEARRAAAAQAPTVAGAERAAKAAEARIAEVAARPEVYMGETYIPKEALPKAKYSVEEVRAKNNELIQKAKDNPTDENFRASRAAVQELQILEDAQQRDVARVSDYRTELDRARQVAADTQEQVRLSNEQLADMQRRAQSPRTTITAEQLDDAEARNQQARFAAQDALNNVDKAERAYNLIRDVDLPNKVPEITSATDLPVDSKLATALLEMHPGRRGILDRLMAEASDLKKQALESGVNLDAPVSDVVADKIGVPRGSSLYSAARRFADHLTTLNVKETIRDAAGNVTQVPGVVSYLREFLMEQGVERGAPEAARWLAKEIEAQNAMAGILEPEFGYVRRPTPTVERIEIQPTGETIARPRAKAEEFAEAMAGGEQARGVRREMQETLREMRDMATKPESPKSITTNNERFNKLLDEYAEKVIETGYDLKSPEFGEEPNAFLNESDRAERQIMTPGKIKQRVLEPLTDDSMQPALHSSEFHRYLMRQTRKRLEAEGMKGKALSEALDQVRSFIKDPKQLSAHSKNRFPDFVYDGKAILTADDFMKAMDSFDPKLMNQARANAFNYVANKNAVAAQTFGMLHSLDQEFNRFRFDENGEWRKNKETNNAPVNASTYATQVAEGVVLNNEAPPVVVPYSGEIMRDALRQVANQDRWSPEQRAKILDMAQDIGQWVSGRNMERVFDGIYDQLFEGTDAKPPNPKNMHMSAAVERALRSQFSALEDINTLNDVADVVQRFARFTKKGVVPLNLRALVNNNLANSVLQIMTRGSAGFLPGLFTESYKMNKYLSGDYEGLSPADMQMYQALANRQTLFRTEFKKLYGDSAAWKKLRDKSGGLRRMEAMLESRDINWMYLPEKYGEFRDFMADMYTKAGDAPFRLEEMVHIYNDFLGKLDQMEAGTTADLRVSKYGELKLKKLENGDFEVVDPTNLQKSKVVAKNSSQLADIVAAAADVLQEEKFLNPERMGVFFKALQRAGLQPLSGIFSWAAGALDIPFVKKGLVSKMMEGPVSFATSSPTVQALQAAQYTSWWLKRMLVMNASQAELLDQRKVDDLNRSLGMNKTLMSIITAQGSKPGFLHTKDTSPLLSGAPTAALFNTIGAIADSVKFSPLFNSPDVLAQYANADRDWAAESPESMEMLKQTNPSMYEYAEEMRQLAKDDPRAYKNRALIKRDMMRWATGEASSPEDVLRMIGLSGSPLLRWAANFLPIGDNKQALSTENMFRQFASMVLGATPYSMGDVGLALAGKAGVTPARRFSTYGTAMTKSGQQADASTMAEWALSQLVGIGWKQAFYGEGDEEPGDERGYGRMKGYLTGAHDKLKSSLEDSYGAQIRKLTSPEDAAEKAQLEESYELLKEGIERYFDKLEADLRQQRKMVNRSE